MVTDPISDFLIRFKHASMRQKESFAMPYSKAKHALADILTNEGYIKAVRKKGKKTIKLLECDLPEGGKKVTAIKRISKPSKRVYMGAEDVRAYGKKGMLIISTSKGLRTGKNALAENIGGEAMCLISYK
jgi:small subunit ribosomal protein S8